MEAQAESARICSGSPASPVMMTSGFQAMICSRVNCAWALPLVDWSTALRPPAALLQSSMIVSVPSRVRV